MTQYITINISLYLKFILYNSAMRQSKYFSISSLCFKIEDDTKVDISIYEVYVMKQYNT